MLALRFLSTRASATHAAAWIVPGTTSFESSQKASARACGDAAVASMSARELLKSIGEDALRRPKQPFSPYAILKPTASANSRISSQRAGVRHPYV